jgi:hypothetical protein
MQAAVLLLACFVYLVQALPDVRRSGSSSTASKAQCRYVPGDLGWPGEADWNTLNRTVGGRLVEGLPLARICFENDYNAAACSSLRETWDFVTPL